MFTRYHFSVLYFLLLSIILSSPLSAEDLPFKKIKITYETVSVITSTGDIAEITKGKETVIADFIQNKYRKVSKARAITENISNSKHEIEIIQKALLNFDSLKSKDATNEIQVYDSELFYAHDILKDNILKQESKNQKVWPLDDIDTDRMSKGGTEEILGRKCTVYKNNEETICIWKGVVLRSKEYPLLDIEESKNSFDSKRVINIDENPEINESLFRKPKAKESKTFDEKLDEIAKKANEKLVGLSK